MRTLIAAAAAMAITAGAFAATDPDDPYAPVLINRAPVTQPAIELPERRPEPPMKLGAAVEDEWEIVDPRPRVQSWRQRCTQAHYREAWRRNGSVGVRLARCPGWRQALWQRSRERD